MKITYFLLVINTLFLQTFAQDPFEVPQEEIGKVGVYTVEQPGVPKHPDYEEIYRHNEGKKLSLDPTKKFYKLQFIKPKFKITAPKTYNPVIPPGIIITDVRNLLEKKNAVQTTLEYLEE